MKFANRKGFTLMEIVIIIAIISVGILSLVVLLSRGNSYVQRSRQKVIALDLAREGMEAVYQIRDTNWKRRSGKRDACRLKINPLLDPEGDGCSNDAWMQSGSYILQLGDFSGQQTYYLTGLSTSIPLNVTDGIGTAELRYSLCLQTGMWIACPGQDSISPEGRFYREIRGYDLQKKDSAAAQRFVCANGASLDADYGMSCDSTIPKEYLFCSIVDYVGEGQGEVKVCGSLTNFIGND